MDERFSLLEMLRQGIKARLSQEHRRSLRRHLAELLSLLYRRDLRQLARIYGSDKWGGHWYSQHYQHHFAHLRNRNIKLLEIGIGGYEDPYSGGSSLRMWRRYFPHAQVYGIDIADKSPHNGRRIRTFRGDQSDEKFLMGVIEEIGKPDIIIDDGSHMNEHVIRSFQVLFPHLADDGIYVVEDTQTSYWPEFGGDGDNLQNAQTSMCMLKNLVDGLNYTELRRTDYRPTYSDRWIVSLHFCHNLVFIHKGANDEAGGIP